MESNHRRPRLQRGALPLSYVGKNLRGPIDWPACRKHPSPVYGFSESISHLQFGKVAILPFTGYPRSPVILDGIAGFEPAQDFRPQSNSLLHYQLCYIPIGAPGRNRTLTVWFEAIRTIRYTTGAWWIHRDLNPEPLG